VLRRDLIKEGEKKGNPGRSHESHADTRGKKEKEFQGRFFSSMKAKTFQKNTTKTEGKDRSEGVKPYHIIRTKKKRIL